MAFFDELKDRAMDLSRAGVAKGKQIAEIAKLNLANTAEEEGIRKAYIEIGKLYYAERGLAPEAAYVSLCEKITSARITIEENRSRINEMKEDGLLKEDDLPPVDVSMPPEEGSIFGAEDHKE